MANTNNSVNIKVSSQGTKEVTKDLSGIANAADAAAKSVRGLVHALFEIDKTRRAFVGLNKDAKSLSQDLQHARREAQFTAQSMDKMATSAGKAGKASVRLGKSTKAAAVGTNSLLKSIRGLLGFGFGIAFIKKIGTEIINYNKSISSLSSAIEKNSGVAGKSLAGLAAQAKNLGNSTGASVVKVRNLQAQMLSFKNVSGDTFDRAIKGALDMSSAFGVEASSAARALGKALDSPGKSLQNLASMGVKFTDAEIKVLKSMADTNKVAEAQDLIMKRLEKSFGGAANASGEYVKNITKIKDETLKLASVGFSTIFGDIPAVGARIEKLERQLKSASSELDKIENAGGDNEAIQRQLLIRERINVSLAEQVVLSNKLRNTDATQQMAAEANLQQAKKNLEIIEVELGLKKDLKSVEADILEIKGKQREANDKLSEGFSEMIDQLGLMNSKSKKLFESFCSIGKILDGFGAKGAGGFFGSLGKMFGFAKGGAFGSGGVQMMAKGGILNKPTCFGTSSGPAIAGEAGPEAVLPLTRGPGGKLGVESSGGGVNVQVIDQRSGGSPVSVEQNGSDVRIMVRDEVKRSFSSGQMDGVMGQQFGLSRVGSFR